MPRRILIADDSITRRTEIEQQLNAQGYDVLAVESGDLALEKLHEYHPHLVMLEAIMPGKNGYDVCSYIKSDPKLNQIPVILTFTEEEPVDLIEVQRVGATRWMPKPVDAENLASALKLIWDGAIETSADMVEKPSEKIVVQNNERPQKSSKDEDAISEVEVVPVSIEDQYSPDDDASSLFEVKVRETNEMKISKNDSPAHGSSSHLDALGATHPIEVIDTEESFPTEESHDDPLQIKEELISSLCRDCGARVVIGDIFCVECGAALDEAVIEASIELHCRQCRENISEGDVFCLNCGAVQ